MITVCGTKISRSDINAVELARPKNAGGYWQGIRHGELVQTIEESARSRGWEIEQELFSLSKDQADMAGAVQLRIPNIEAPDGMAYSLGFLTSNARRRALTMVVGTRIFVCNNGMATGQIVMNRRHTSGVSLFDEVDDALDIYEERIKDVPTKIAGWQKRELSRNETNEILIQTGERGILPWSRVGQVADEFKRPTFSDFNERTSWGLLNAFTYVAQKQSPLTQMDSLSAFQEILPMAASKN